MELRTPQMNNFATALELTPMPSSELCDVSTAIEEPDPSFIQSPFIQKLATLPCMGLFLALEMNGKLLSFSSILFPLACL